MFHGSVLRRLLGVSMKQSACQVLLLSVRLITMRESGVGSRESGVGNMHLGFDDTLLAEDFVEPFDRLHDLVRRRAADSFPDSPKPPPRL